MKCDFGWADLGTWHSIYEAMQKSDDDNVVIDSDVMMENCHNNVIKLPKGKLAVLNGLDGLSLPRKTMCCSSAGRKILPHWFANM